jgi:hypothetical protein
MPFDGSISIASAQKGPWIDARKNPARIRNATAHLPPESAAWKRRFPTALSPERPFAFRVLTAIQQSGVDAVVGYTQRFRCRWLAARRKYAPGSWAMSPSSHRVLS